MEAMPIHDRFYRFPVTDELVEAQRKRRKQKREKKRKIIFLPLIQGTHRIRKKEKTRFSAAYRTRDPRSINHTGNVLRIPWMRASIIHLDRGWHLSPLIPRSTGIANWNIIHSDDILSANEFDRFPQEKKDISFLRLKKSIYATSVPVSFENKMGRTCHLFSKEIAHASGSNLTCLVAGTKQWYPHDVFRWKFLTVRIR